jgi:hypothetical protein
MSPDEMRHTLQPSSTGIWLRLSSGLVTNVLLFVIALLLVVQEVRPHAGRYQWNHAAEKAGMVGVFDTATGKLYLTNDGRTWAVNLAHEKKAKPSVAPQPEPSDLPEGGR